MKKYFILIFVLIFISSVYAECGDPQSGYDPTYSTTTGCNSDCFKGVKLEGKCYDCGYDGDEVCPEYFFDGGTCDPVDCDCDGYESDPKCTGVAEECTLDLGRWENGNSQLITSAKEGNKVYLYVSGTNCGGKTVSFEVFEDDLTGDDPVTTNPQSVILELGSAKGEWTVEYIDDGALGGDPEYYFTASIGESSVDSGLIDVSKSAGAESLCSADPKCSDYDIYGADSCNSDLCNVFDYEEGYVYVEGDEVCAWEIDLEECKSAYLCDLDEEYLMPTIDEAECNSLKESDCDYDCGSCPGSACTLISGGSGCSATISCPPGSAAAGPSYQEPVQQFPVFTWFNLIITSLIIVGFYIFVYKKK